MSGYSRPSCSLMILVNTPRVVGISCFTSCFTKDFVTNVERGNVSIELVQFIS